MITLKTQDMEDVRVVSFKLDTMREDRVIEQVGEDLKSVASSLAEDQKVLLTFRGVIYMSSTMLGKLIAFRKLCERAGVPLKFCSIAPDLVQVFKITGLDKLFDIQKDEQQALKAFAKKGWFK